MDRVGIGPERRRQQLRKYSKGMIQRVGIAHAQAPERVTALEKMVRELRPQAEIEHVTTLGAVVGTHAGPGTVGLFWFADAY